MGWISTVGLPRCWMMHLWIMPVGLPSTAAILLQLKPHCHGSQNCSVSVARTWRVNTPDFSHQQWPTSLHSAAAFALWVLAMLILWLQELRRQGFSSPGLESLAAGSHRKKPVEGVFLLYSVGYRFKTQSIIHLTMIPWCGSSNLWIWIIIFKIECIYILNMK